MLGEALVAEVGPIDKDNGEPRRTVTLVVLAGAREAQTLRGKLVGPACALADGLEPYTKVAFLGVYRSGAYKGIEYHSVALAALERIA